MAPSYFLIYLALQYRFDPLQGALLKTVICTTSLMVIEEEAS